MYNKSREKSSIDSGLNYYNRTSKKKQMSFCCCCVWKKKIMTHNKQTAHTHTNNTVTHNHAENQKKKTEIYHCLSFRLK